MQGRKCGVLCLGLTLSCGVVAEQPAQEVVAGGKLFEQYGCTNCHGPEGVHPSSKHVPVLKGKSADYLFERATAILTATGADAQMHAMHAQFCVGETPEEGCYPKPSSEELSAIAAWLGASSLPEKKRTPQELYVTATEAYAELNELGDTALFVDVRTRSEVAFLGMAEGADANIPFMTEGDFIEWDEEKSNFKMRPNSRFVASIGKLVDNRGLNKDSPIFLMCRSGSRSAKAATMLNLVGYTQVYNIIDGYEGDTAKDGPSKGERVVNGWKNSGLPWTYKLSKDAMYWDE